MVKIFFLGDPREFRRIYRRINGTLKLDFKNWQKYVNSKELNDLILDKLATISTYGLQTLAYAELAEDYGVEIHLDGAIYLAMPFIAHPLTQFTRERIEARMRPNCSVGYRLYPHPLEAEGLVQTAARAFITTLNHYVFTLLTKKPFMILRTVTGWRKLDAELNYQPITVEGIPI